MRGEPLWRVHGYVFAVLALDRLLIEAMRERAARVLDLAGTVDVGAVLDGHDIDAVVLVIDAVDDPVVTASRAMQPFEAESERLADPVWIRSQ